MGRVCAGKLLFLDHDFCVRRERPIWQIPRVLDGFELNVLFGVLFIAWTESEDVESPPNADCEYWRGELSTSSDSSRLHGCHAVCVFCRSSLRCITCLLLYVLSNSWDTHHSPESSSLPPPLLQIQLSGARPPPCDVVPLMKTRPSIAKRLHSRLITVFRF